MPDTTLLGQPHPVEKLRSEELEEARALQRSMLPEKALRTGSAFVSHGFQPAATVGGDFLDYFELSNNTIGLYLGDVSGKGLPAALYAGLTVGTLRGVHKSGTPPHAVLSTLNRRLMIRGMPRRYAAVLYAVFDPSNNQLQIANAGMPSPLHFSPNGCSVLDVSGVPSGLLLESEYETLAIRMSPGDSVLFYTDGLTDACAPDEEHFGAERLRALCNSQRHQTPSDILRGIFMAADDFIRGREQYDDIAATLLRCAAS